MASDSLPPILVSGGVVETRDSTLVQAGEMVRATDAYYKPNNPALWSVLGRKAFNNVPAGSPILGVRFLEYDNAPDAIVIHLGNKFREAPAGLTGVFTTPMDAAANGLTAAGVTSFDSCHYGNRQFLFDGVNRNRVRNKDGSYGFHGMLAATNPPTVTNTGSGTGFNLTSGNDIVYWIEERTKDMAGNIVKRNATLSNMNTVTLSAPQTGVKPVITRPAIVNPDATHWAVYATKAGGAFPNGAEVGEEIVANSDIEDTRIGTDPGLPVGETYDIIAVVLPGTTVAELFARNGPVPIATSADIQEDSIVMNDVSDKTKVWFTFPDEPDAVPPVNFIRFSTKEADEVQWVRFLGQATVVGLRDSIWKITILPQASDSTFEINRVKSQLEGAHGGIGPLTVAAFSFGEKNLLAYVSRAGIFVTDGEVWHILTGDIDWIDRVSIPDLARSILVNNPLEFRLEFTYTPKGGAINSKTLFLHYHPSHVKQSPLGLPQAKVTVPINRGGLCKVQANINGNDVVFSGQTNGRLYQEWAGLVDPLGDIEFEILTSEKYPFGLGHYARTERAWVHHQAGAKGQRLDVFALQRTEGQDDVEEKRDIPIHRREPTSFYPNIEYEAVQFGVRATNPSAQIGIDYFVMDAEDKGPTSAAGEE